MERKYNELVTAQKKKNSDKTKALFTCKLNQSLLIMPGIGRNAKNSIFIMPHHDMVSYTRDKEPATESEII